MPVTAAEAARPARGRQYAMPTPVFDVSPSDIVASILAVIALMFCQQGVIYYVLQFGFGIELRDPYLVFGLLTLLVVTVPFIFLLTAAETATIVGFFALNCWLTATAMWSPAEIYLAIKVPQTLVFPTLCLLAGFAIGRGGTSRMLAITSMVIACAMALSFLRSGQTADSFGFTSGVRESIISYQNFSLAMALGCLGGGYMIIVTGRIATRLVCLLVIPIFIYFIALSGGRTGIAFAAIGLVTMTLYMVRLQAITLAILATVAGFASLAGYYILEAYAIPIWLDDQMPTTIRRIVYSLYLADSMHFDDHSRSVIYSAAIDIFQANPVFGVGWAGFPVAADLPDDPGNYPHNLFLELLTETGLLGFLPVMVFFGLLVKRTLAGGGDRAARALMWGLFMASFVWSFVIGDWPGQRLLFLSFGMMLGLRGLEDKTPAAASGRLPNPNSKG